MPVLELDLFFTANSTRSLIKGIMVDCNFDSKKLEISVIKIKYQVKVCEVNN